MTNLLRNIPENLPDELFETLVETEAVHIERIVSRGHITPPGDWYDQETREWVTVLQGSARLEFEGGREVSLVTGDTLTIEAHDRHRVAWTDPEQETIWLAVHYPA